MNIVKNNKNDTTPVLEDFGLDFPIYNDYQREKQRLENIFENEKEKNHNIVNKCTQIIRSIENNTFIILSFILFWFGILFGWCYVLFKIISNNELAAILSFFSFYVWLSFNEWMGEKSKFAISSFVYNLLTLGKYTKNKISKENAEKSLRVILQKEEQLFEGITKNVHEKVAQFEKAFYDYYQNKLDEFYSTRLFKKRSGTAEFEESLTEFETIINDLSEANKILLTKSFDLWSYKDYLDKRKGNHFIQQDKTASKEFLPIGDFVKKVSESKIENKEIAPEERYRTPRKIDWENVNKNNQITGLKGEEIVVEIEKNYLKEIGKVGLAEKVRHVAKEDGDGLGYDILSFFPDGREKYIEVKSTKNSPDSQFIISRNELSFIQDNSENAFIYRVQITDNDEPKLLVKNSREVFEEMEIIPDRFIARNK
ncbi:MAG: DUF3883 domain-containing protein [Candidatus Moranbacteria bacterium]|nr:DUF3883 domain-containing protein [Candidatus Moranbacteria bacterium]